VRRFTLAGERAQVGPVTLVSSGPRSSLFAVVAAGLEREAITREAKSGLPRAAALV
jgi:hypothetical protein